MQSEESVLIVISPLIIKSIATIIVNKKRTWPKEHVQYFTKSTNFDSLTQNQNILVRHAVEGRIELKVIISAKFINMNKKINNHT